MSTHDLSLTTLLCALRPRLNQGTFVFASIPLQTDFSTLHTLATFCEADGLTLIVEESEASRAGLKFLFRAAWITLEVQSDLAAVGLTAAVSSALASENIACNIVAAAHHDHLFVPVELGSKALAVLKSLQTGTPRE